MANESDHATPILVTPVWRDSARLARFGRELAQELAEREADLRWVVGDDGSGERERESLENLLATFVPIYPRVELNLAEAHRGKGSVVRESWKLDPQAACYAFVDADGSVSAGEMLDLIESAMRLKQSVIGIRKATATKTVEEGPIRKLMHESFRAACRRIVGLESEDTQCGAKVVHGPDYRKIQSSLQEDGLAFDVELLAALSAAGCRWTEVPVNWSGKEGSRISPMGDAVDMIEALFRIRKRRRLG